MKIFYFIVLVISTLFVISCDGLNSELKSPIISLANQKPHCSFKIKSNCWQSSVEKIISCIDVSDEIEPEYFSDDYLLCENSKGKTIRFENEFNPEVDLNKEQVNFRVYNKNVPCLQFIGNSTSFLIKSPIYGSISVNKLSNGDSFVSCLNGESFVITNEIKEKGCDNQNEKIMDYLPMVQLSKEELVRSTLFSFFILGDSKNRSPIFSCK